jgi:hypothetical protein
MRIVLPALLFLATFPSSAAEPTGTIDGQVTEGGKAVAGALVSAVAPQSWQPSAIVRTDPQGHFHFGALAPAKYGVTATAVGHTAGLTLDVAVAAGGSARADVKLGGESVVVSGAILDDTTGSPITDAKVVAARESEAEGGRRSRAHRVREPTPY